MNKQHIASLETMQSSDEIVHVLNDTTAATLIGEGYVRAVALDPMPTDGTPVNLTALGRGYQAQTRADSAPD